MQWLHTYVLTINGNYKVGETGHGLKACCYLQPHILGWTRHRNRLQSLPDHEEFAPDHFGDDRFTNQELEVQGGITLPSCQKSERKEKKKLVLQ